jgi:hypothetical protein
MGELLVLENVPYLSDDALPMHLPRIRIGKRHQNRLSLYVSKMSMDGCSKVEPWVLVLLMAHVNGSVEQMTVPAHTFYNTNYLSFLLPEF